MLAGWIEDHFMNALTFVLNQNDFVVETTLVGAVLSGLSHLKGVKSKGAFGCALLRGMGANLNEDSKAVLAKEVHINEIIFKLSIIIIMISIIVKLNISIFNNTFFLPASI